MTSPLPAELALDEVPFTVEDLAVAALAADDLEHLRDYPYEDPDVLTDEAAHRQAAMRRVGMFAPSSDADAEFLMRLLTGAQTSARGVHLQAAAWRDRIDTWEAEEAHEPERVAALAESLLLDYGARTRETAKRATVHLPAGTIRTRAQNVGGVVKVVDEDAVIEWAGDNLTTDDYDEVVRTKRSVVIAELRKRVTILKRPAEVPEGEDPQDPPATETVVLDEAGAIVPGVEVAPETYTVTVTPGPAE